MTPPDAPDFFISDPAVPVDLRLEAAGLASDRPAACGFSVDGEGPAIVPEVAAEILGDGGDVARLVRRYERVVERFEACWAVNANERSAQELARLRAAEAELLELKSRDATPA